jgi:hypothetical protein
MVWIIIVASITIHIMPIGDGGGTTQGVTTIMMNTTITAMIIIHIQDLKISPNLNPIGFQMASSNHYPDQRILAKKEIGNAKKRPGCIVRQDPAVLMATGEAMANLIRILTRLRQPPDITIRHRHRLIRLLA